MALVITPKPAPLVPGGRALVRGLALLVPIALALAIVAGWLRPLVVRPSAVVAPASVSASASESLSPIDQERRLSEAIERARVSTVALEYGSGDLAGVRRIATGVVVSDLGDVLSVRVNPPEGRERESILARDSAGHKHPARWVAADPETGLTLLRLEAHDIRPIHPSSRAAVLGAAVFLIGNPYGLSLSVTRGNVAGLARRLEVEPRPLGGLIQFQAPLHPGDSGALLADMEGGWLGLVRGGVAAPGAKDDNDMGFAIPAIDAMWIADQLLAHRKVDRAYLGIKLVDDSSDPGAKVASVVPASPADQAKLQPGDRIIRLDDRPIATPDDLTDRLDRTPAGAEVVVDYVRGQAVRTLTVKTVARPLRTPLPASAQSPSPSPPPAPTPASASSPAPAVARELLERLEHLERQVEELRRRESRAANP